MLATFQFRTFWILVCSLKTKTENKKRIHKTIILPSVLYGCETRFLISREEMRVFENRVQMRIISPKRDEMKGGWSKLHNEELHFSKYN
jgi:hypothetical protein